MVFERLLERADGLAGRRARVRAAELAQRIEAELPPGIAVEAAADGVRFSGRDIARRFALEPGLRWLLAGLR